MFLSFLSTIPLSEFNTDGTAQENFEVPVGDYYKCDSLNMTATPFLVNLTKPVFQPFVEKTKGGDSLGNGKGKMFLFFSLGCPKHHMFIGLLIYFFLTFALRTKCNIMNEHLL